MKTPQAFTLKLLPLAVAAIYSPWALAQSNAADNTQVVEITAQKRVEKIKDVPLSVTAISGQTLEDRGVEGPAALAGAIPNLNISQAPASGLIAAVGMRGLASGQPQIWADPAVGLYVDGVFVGKNMGALFDVLDIARLEALRGPQGTLFGRNTEAGAINFITRKPSGVFGGSIALEAGNYGRQVGRVSVDLPKAGILSASVALRTEKQDGFIANPNGEAWGSKDRQAGRVALRVQPSKNLTVDFAYDRSDIDETATAGALVSSTGYGSLYPLTTQIGGTTFAFQNPSCLQRNAQNVCVFPSPGIGPAIRPFETPGYPSSVASTTTFGRNYQRMALDGHSFHIEYKLNNNHTFKLITANRDMRYGDHVDLDGTALNIFDTLRETHYKSQSYEAQLVGNVGGMRYVAGVYIFNDAGTSNNNQSGGLLTFHPNVPSFQASNFSVGTEAKAVYGQVDFDIGKFGLGLGGRYTEEDKSVSATRYRTNASFAQQGAATLDSAAGASFSQFTPTFNLVYRLNNDINLFGRVAKGFKSGGFPAEAPVTATSSPTTPYKPEVSTAIELGLKGNFMGGRGAFSANIFRTNVRDYHVSLLPAGSINPTIVNAGKLRTQGFELDASVAPAAGTRITLGYGYLEAKFLEYMALSATNQPVNAASNTVVPAAPKHTLSLNLDQRLAQLKGGTSVRGLVNYRYVSERYTYPGQISATAPNATVGNTAASSLNPALTLVDLRLIVGGVKLGGPGDAEFSLFVKNATDQKKKVAHIDVSGFYQLAYYSDPRTYGATFTYRW